MIKKISLLLAFLILIPYTASAAKLSGKVTELRGRQQVPCADVTVIIGPTIRWVSEGPTDAIIGSVIAKTKTNREGHFEVNIPSGAYTVIFWKQLYMPTMEDVTLPASIQTELIYDMQNRPNYLTKHLTLELRP